MNDQNADVAELLLYAPAKINLILKVVRKRQDGYHELETWMQKLGLYDTITLKIKPSPGITLSCSSKEIPAGGSNLVWRAAELFLNSSRRAEGKGVALHLEKKIPIAAGLGGGSSDAGTLLRGLNDHFGNEFDEQEIIEMAKSLGADVPFFVTNHKSVLATGIGDKMIAVKPLFNCTFILVNPGVSVSTAEVFKKYALTRVNKNSTLTGSQKLNPHELTLSALQNDLERVTIAMFPVIDEVKRDLMAFGADSVLMSGSGATVFGVFVNSSGKQNEIEVAASSLRQKFGDKVFIA